jgi:hypothetical protein
MRAPARTSIIATVVAATLAVVVAFAVFRPDRAVIDQRVDDVLPTELAEVLDPPSPTTDPARTAPSPVQAVPPPDAPKPSPAPPAGPVLVADGSFISQGGHNVQGRAAVLDTDQGRVLVLEDLDSDNGPDLQLYLSPSSAGSVDGGRLLEPLRGNQGTQLYRLPDDVDLAATANVVVWCERFSTPFGTATLVPAA